MVEARVWWAAAVVVPVVLVGATSLTAVLPMREEAGDLRGQTQEQNDQNDVQRIENASLALRVGGIDELRAEFATVQHRVPPWLDQERLSREIHDRSTATGMTLSRFTQGAAVIVEASPQYVTVPIDLEFTGPVHADRARLLASLQGGPGSEHGEGLDLFVTDVALLDDDEDTDEAQALAVRGFLVLSTPVPEPDVPEPDAEVES